MTVLIAVLALLLAIGLLALALAIASWIGTGKYHE